MRNTCTAINPALVTQYADHLRPVSKEDPPKQLEACAGWEVASIPPGPEPQLTGAEQLVLVRWVATGAAR